MSGNTPHSTNTPPPSFLRRASPFVRRPRNIVRTKNGRAATPLADNNRRPGGTVGGSPGGAAGAPGGSTTGARVAVKKEQSDELEQFQDFSITACTKEEIENIQYHLMKLQSRKEVNPLKDFSKPIRLHRKDPRNMQYQLTLKEIEEREQLNAELKLQQEQRKAAATGGGIVNGTDSNGKAVNTDAVFDLDAAQLEAEQAEEEAPSVAPEPEAKQQTNVAPDGKPKNRNKRKTREVRVMNEDARKLRYEEFYPWVMEDYDGENTYVGNYEAATTIGHNHALLVPASNGGFKMIPINKIYRFTPRNKYATLTLEEAEAKLSNNSVSRWLMQKLDTDENTSNSRASKMMNARSRRFRALSHDNLFGEDDDDEQKQYSDNEGMDFDEEFADDEEAPIVGGDDEEEKESRKRMEKEMLRANTGLEVRFDDDENEAFDDEQKKKFDKEGKKLKKTLGKNEYGQIMYDSEDEENPYLSKSDLETSEDEAEVKKEDQSAELSGSQKPSKTTSPMPQAPQISVKLPVNNPIGVVTIKAAVQILSQFPRGEWAPAISKKRSFATMANGTLEAKPAKKVKVKSPSPSAVIAAAPSPGVSASPGSPGSLGSPILAPSPKATFLSPGDASTGASTEIATASDPSLLTQAEIIDLIKNNELTTKELFQSLKNKITKNRANKEIFKTLIKKLAKVRTKENGTKVLMLKDPSL